MTDFVAFARTTLDQLNSGQFDAVHKQFTDQLAQAVPPDTLKAQWEQLFASSLEGLPILRVLVTHMHPDHIGLAHWLCERWSTPEHPCRLWISTGDFNAARMASQSTTGFGGDAAAEFFISHGKGLALL